MDTKLKKFKYSIFTKVLCWLIAVLTFCFSFSLALKIGVNCYMVGIENYLQEREVSFYNTNSFLERFQSDFFNAAQLSSRNDTLIKKNLSEQKDKVVKKVYDDFVAEKVHIIKQELRYAVENWDDSYYEYEEYAETITTPEDYTSVYVGENTPVNVELAAKVLANAKGEEFLDYENLVRESAFEGHFSAVQEIVVDSASDSKWDFIIPYNYSKEQAKTFISEEYDDFLSDYIHLNYDYEGQFYRLSQVNNLKYYIEDFDGTVTSNIEKIPENLKNNTHYLLVNGDNYEIKGFDVLSNIEDSIENSDYNVICLYFDESFSESDIYSRMYETYKLINSEKVNTLIITFAIALLISVLFFILWLLITGKRPNSEKAKLLFIDKLPNDIHLVLSVGIITAVSYAMLELFDVYIQAMEYTDRLNHFFSFYATFCFIILGEWIASVVRTKKAGESYFKNTVIYKFLKLIFKISTKLFKKLKKEFGYKPTSFKIRIVLAFVIYVIVNIALVALFFADMGYGYGFFIITTPIVFVIFNGFVCYQMARYVNNLDKIIVASGKNEDVDFENKKVDSSLTKLAENLKNSNQNLNKAVAEAVKNEQMKTELITNVSHDLKTPLTSLINYSDLLGKCNVDDEKANEYIKVLNTQSIKLKHLIDDLIEASKVSTGNVQFNKINLNLYELVVQAMVEFTPDFEKNMLDVKLQEPTNTPVVYADGNKTYRIISNLLSNVKKYAAPNTRVYASVYSEDQFGCFEIKNISKEALNISPDELVERFVRGDESRSKEGNGLGLSIAKDLCELQNGELKISIDGDLFKVVVKLPVK